MGPTPGVWITIHDNDLYFFLDTFILGLWHIGAFFRLSCIETTLCLCRSHPVHIAPLDMGPFGSYTHGTRVGLDNYLGMVCRV
jgi:hypothetical protein